MKVYVLLRAVNSQWGASTPELVAVYATRRGAKCEMVRRQAKPNAWSHSYLYTIKPYEVKEDEHARQD